jgi:hypothetical protein
MVNRSDRMTEHAAYVGAGVSTLDMPDMRWHRAAMTADTALDLPGRGFVLLHDGTAMLIERHAHRSFSEHGVWSNRSLDLRPGHHTRVWTRAPRLVEDANEQTRQVWVQLRALHDVLRSTAAPGQAS